MSRSKLCSAVILSAVTMLGVERAVAADAVDLAVAGNVVPAACIPALSSPSLDYGIIPVSELSASTPTSLTPQRTTLNLTCDAAAKVAVRAIDNRLGTAFAPQSDRFGLGNASDGSPIGWYDLDVDSSAFGGGAAGSDISLLSRDDGQSWSTLGEGLFEMEPGPLYAVAGFASSKPGAFASYRYDMFVNATVAPTGQLPVVDSIEIDGSVTFELIYL